MNATGTTGTPGAYPVVGSPMSRQDFDAMIGTLATWINDRGQRLVEMDERSAASPDQRTDVDLAFVLWQSITERRDELTALPWRDRSNPNHDVSPLVWTQLSDRSGAPLAADLPEAVTLVDELVRRVTTSLDRAETSNVEGHRARTAIDADLDVAERLAADLGDQVRATAELRRELDRLTTSLVTTSGTAEGELDESTLARLGTSAASLRADLEATERDRATSLAACAGAVDDLARLRDLESEARDAVAACVDRFTTPPRLAVPSVDAVELPPPDLAQQPWPRARPIAEGFTRTVDRVERALRAVIEANTAPRRRRDDLRGLLQSYRDKADAFGAAELPEIDSAYRAARTELWSAPCDLARAETLTAEYQGLVTALAAVGRSAAQSSARTADPTADHPADVETP